VNDREQRLRAIGALIWSDPGRIMENAARLRGTDAVIEMQLRGGSMGAAIPAGSTLRIALGRTGPCRIGEVVAFVRRSDVCVHRVAYLGRGARAHEYLVTQGDGCYYPDPPIRASEVLGPVVEFRHDGVWRRTGEQPSPDRAQSAIGRGLLCLVANLMEYSVPLARAAARHP
jgi:hypothetical protein